MLSTHLPPAEDDEYTWKLNYDLVPNNTGLLRLLAWYWGIVMAIAVSLFVIQLVLYTGYIGSGQLTVAGFTPGATGRTISTGIVSITVGVMYALRAEWAERYRILCIAPILFHGVSWVLWAVVV